MPAILSIPKSSHAVKLRGWDDGFVAPDLSSVPRKRPRWWLSLGIPLGQLCELAASC